MRRFAPIAAVVICAASLADDSALSVVPRPAKIEPASGEYVLTAQTDVVVKDAISDAPAGGRFVADMLNAYAGWKLKPQGTGPASDPVIELDGWAADDSLPVGGYKLDVRRHGIHIQAKSEDGFFYAAQTLRQLLPTAPNDGARSLALEKIGVPCVSIVDGPRYRHRGMLLDCGRHFMEKEFVKRTIDLLAYHKMNVLHWHLTEDQGWRIEIKKYPKLTEVGAWRKATRESEQPRAGAGATPTSGEAAGSYGAGRYGGFYTQADIREIVAYAQSRYVTVIPEIEMPGHCRAALASYPEYSCTGGPFEVATQWGVEPDVYCAGNDATFEFLENVLREVMELFPSKLIHIGGDECPKDRWQKCPKCQARIKAGGLKDEHELQSYFIRRIEKFLNNKGRRLIGWDEILEGGLAPNATVQSWRGMDGAVAAATTGHDVISSPTSHCYLDYPQGPNANLPGWMGYVDLAKAYSFEPTPARLNAKQAKHVLGLEGNIWTEHAPQSRVDWQVFPRLCALAEVGWSSAESRDWNDFQRRMKTHYRRLDALAVTYYVPIPEFTGPNTFADTATIDLSAPIDGASVHYMLDGREPTPQSPKFDEPIPICAATTVKARTILASGRQSDVAQREYRKLIAHEPVQVADRAPGLLYSDYLGAFSKLPDMSTMTPVAVGVLVAPTLMAAPRADAFCRRFEGDISAPADGVYTFFVISDDGSRLYLGDELVVDNDGPHSATEKTGSALLKKGLHPFKLDYCEIGGDQTLQVAWSGPGFEKQPLGDSVIQRSAARETDLRRAFDAATPRGPETVLPVPRTDDGWTARHAELCKRSRQKGVKVLFIGDSITHGWEGDGRAAWAKHYAPLGAVNLGIGGDRTQHVLWRLRNGNLAGFIQSPADAPKAAVLMIGTNNSNGNDNTPAEIAVGIDAIVKELRAKLPQTKILILGIFPRNERPDAQRAKNATASKIASTLADGKMVYYLDIGPKFLKDDGTLTRDIMPDLLHLSPRGYEIWAEAINPKLHELLGE